MGKKTHLGLSQSFEDHFPDLFNFEFAQILFLDKNDGSLFKITDPIALGQQEEVDSDNPETTGNRMRRPKPVIMRLPKDRGFTGKSIQEKSAQKSDEG